MEKAMAPHSSTLAWKIPWTEEPGRLQSMGSWRVRHDWATALSLFTFMHWRRKWQPTPVFLSEESQGQGSLVGCRLGLHRVGHDWSDLAEAAAAASPGREELKDRRKKQWEKTSQGLPFISSVQFSRSVMSDSLWPHGLQHARPPCSSRTPRVHPNSCPLSQWCHPTISSSVVPFSSCLQSLPASGPFKMSQLFPSGGQSTGLSAPTLVLPMNTRDWSPLGWIGFISLQSKGL